MVNFALMNGRGQETLAEYVFRVRKEKRLSLNDVAEKGKISNAYVSKIENGYSKKPSLPRLRALAKGLEIDADELIAVANGKPLSESKKSSSRFASLLEDIENLNPSDKNFVLKGLESLAVQVRERIESYKTPELYGIDGVKNIDLREFIRAVKREYPEFATDQILDILGGHDLEKYTDEQIAIIRKFEDRFKKKDRDDALTITG